MLFLILAGSILIFMTVTLLMFVAAGLRFDTNQNQHTD